MSDDSAVDPSLDLKKRARRRLVGAVALALLAATILPLVMDAEPKPAGQDILIHIPSQDDVVSSPRANPNQTSTTSQAKTIEPPKVVSGSEAPPLKPPQAAEKQPSVTPVEPKAKEAATNKTEVVRAEAALQGKDDAQWVVQLGAYQNAGNVKLLTGKIKEMGLPTYTEKLESAQGTRTRVRAGPFKSQETAEKARQRIKQIGVDGPVVQK